MDAFLPKVLMESKPGVIDLGWGHPSPRLHPIDAVKEAADKLFSLKNTEPLQYGATQGYGPYLLALSEFLSRQESYGMKIDPHSLFLTAGASQGLDLTCTLFAREGETVLVEQPTYFVVEGIFRDHHLDVQGVPTDEFGLDVDILESLLVDRKFKPKFLYTIPSYHNPTGSVLPAERRRKLVELAHRFDFLLLADDVYQMIHFGDVPPKPIIAFDDIDDGKTISYGSFSKILSPGLRIGWIHASKAIITRFANASVTFSGGGFNHFASALVKELIELSLLDQNLRRLRSTYSARADAMNAAIRKNFGGQVEFAKPSGGYYFWLRLLNAIDTTELLPIAEKQGVSFRPGNVFGSSNYFSDFLRLTYTFYETDELDEGLRRLSTAVITAIEKRVL